MAGSGILTPYVDFGGDVDFNQFGRVIFRNVDGATLNRSGDVNFAAGAIGEFSADNVGGLVTNYTVNQNGAVNLQSGSIARFNLADVASTINLTGGLVLNGMQAYRSKAGTLIRL